MLRVEEFERTWKYIYIVCTDVDDPADDASKFRGWWCNLCAVWPIAKRGLIWIFFLSANFIIPIGYDCWVSGSGQGSTHENKLWRCWFCCSQATATRELGSGQMQFLRLWKLSVNRPAAKKKRKFNSDGNESHQDGGSDEQSEDEVASSGDLITIFWIEELRNRWSPVQLNSIYEEAPKLSQRNMRSLVLLRHELPLICF